MKHYAFKWHGERRLDAHKALRKVYPHLGLRDAFETVQTGFLTIEAGDEQRLVEAGFGLREVFGYKVHSRPIVDGFGEERGAIVWGEEVLHTFGKGA
jgi:hypothetical protein